MLTILLESFLMEIAQNNLNADKEINYLFETINKSHITDLQKLIKESNMDIQEFKILAYGIINSEEFKEELSDLNINIIKTPSKEIQAVCDDIINELMQEDKNATWDEIYNEYDYNYESIVYGLIDSLELSSEIYKDDKEVFDYYTSLINRIKEVL